MSTEADPIIQAALEMAKKKQSPDHLKKMEIRRTYEETLGKLSEALSNRSYCAKCEYPVVGGRCINCENEQIAAAALEKKYAEALGGQKAWREYTSVGFEVTEHNRAAFKACQDFDPALHNLYIYGPVGAGKSRLAAIAKRRWVLHDLPTKTLSLDDFYLELRANIKNAREQKAMLDSVIRSPILGIEDVGVESSSEFSTTTMWAVIDGRYKAQRNGLVITSNLSPEDLALRMKNARVSSRLVEMCGKGRFVFNLKGQWDWRTRC